MDKCRICLRFRKNALSIYTKTDGITFADMITSIANIKIRNEDGITNKICRSCRGKLIDAYNFKIAIERSEMVLQETSTLKRINFSNLNDIKIKIEIETDFKPIVPAMGNIFERIFDDDTDILSYNNTLIKKIDCLNHNDKNNKSLSVGEFLNSMNIESDDALNYEDYDIGADDYNSDSGSNFSNEECLLNRKKKKKKATKKTKEVKICQTRSNLNESMMSLPKPVKPKLIDDLRATRTKVKFVRKTRQLNKRNIYVKPASICPYCGKLSKSINAHILLHTAERKFKCDQCAKAFLTEGALERHRILHSQNKNFKCDQCIAAFNNKSSLQSHIMMHRDEKKHVCSICSKAFKRKSLLTRHMMIHNFGSKHIQCELCPMTFYTQYNLRHHMRVHTGERPFKCEICSQPYSYKHDFNRHCLKKHGVFLKRRSIRVMNEEVLQQERALMRELSVRAHGIVKDGELENPFDGDGPQAALAYEQAIKALKENKIPKFF